MDENLLHYSARELLPIVQRLTQKYTGQESTSVTYETAQQLMGAVFYCIHENEMETAEETSDKVSTELMKQNDAPTAREAYETGYRLCGRKFIRANELYVEIMSDFNSYGNQACYETVAKGMPVFFQNYDIRFSPQDHILTLDYPVLYDLHEVQGVDAIFRYLTCIYMEQLFLNRLTEGLPEQILSAYRGDYRSLFFNLCSIVLRRILICGMLHESISKEVFSETDHQKIAAFLLPFGKKHVEEKAEKVLREFLNAEYSDYPKLFSYLKMALPDFSSELYLAVQNECLHQFLV